MKTRWIAVALCALAVVFVALGLVLRNEADFSHDYLEGQLAEREIIFTPAEALLPEQQDVPCLVENAGKPLLTGKQAECYAKYQIGIDLNYIDEGKTYFESHYNGYLARVEAATALESNPDAPETLELVKKAEEQSRKADDLLAGEATRGLLLTGYGFSVIGDRLSQAAIASFIVAGLLLLAAIVIFVVSARKRPESTESHSGPPSTLATNA